MKSKHIELLGKKKMTEYKMSLVNYPHPKG